MGEFQKWPSIDNSYQEKNISRWIEREPGLFHCDYEITSKLDGSNISFYFNKKEMKVFSRNNRIGDGDSFFGVWDVIKGREYVDFFNYLKNVMIGDIQSIQVYGEIVGPGIQKRINYGDKKFIRFFGICINDILQSPYVSREFIPEELYVPIMGIAKGLTEALAWNENFVEPLSVNGDISEGIVIKPYNKVYISPVDEIFLLKKKTKEFTEKMGKKIKVDGTMHPMESWRVEFLNYITENRVLSVFSKEGEIKSPTEIGKYISWVSLDAQKDFLKDYESEETLQNLDKKDAKYIFNSAGSKVNKILQKYL